MKKEVFKAEFFKISALTDTLNLHKLLSNHKVLVTYNQLMKAEFPIGYVFIFDENEVEVPSLIAYCGHFAIPLYKMCKEEVSEIQSSIKHAKMLAVEANSDICSIIENQIKRDKVYEISLDLQKIEI